MAKLAGGVFLRTVRRTDGFAEAAYLTQENMGSKGRISGNLSSASFFRGCSESLNCTFCPSSGVLKCPLHIRQLSWLLFFWNDLPGWT